MTTRRQTRGTHFPEDREPEAGYPVRWHFQCPDTGEALIAKYGPDVDTGEGLLTIEAEEDDVCDGTEAWIESTAGSYDGFQGRRNVADIGEAIRVLRYNGCDREDVN